MIHYILADLKRIIRRIPFLICMLITVATLVIAFVYSYATQDWNAVTFQMTIRVYSNLLLTHLLGLFVYIAVFSDDCKAKTMQVAIGTGLSRRAVVLSKFADVCIVTFGALIFLVLVCIVAQPVLGVSMVASQYGDVALGFIQAGVHIIGYICITMIPTFLMQSAGFGTLFYLALSTGLVGWLLDLLFKMKYVQGLHLDQTHFNILVDKVFTRLESGVFDAASFIGVVIYIVCAVLITVLLFRKRELEF